MEGDNVQKRTRKEFFYGILSVSLIMFISLSLNGILGLSGFEKSFRDSLINKFNIHAKNLKTEIEASMRFGKPLHLFGGSMDKMFNEIKNLEADVKNIYVVTVNDKVLYSTRKEVVNKKLPFIHNLKDKITGNDLEVVNFYSSYFVKKAILSGSGEFAGYVFLEFDKEIITNRITAVVIEILKYSLIIFIAVIIIMIAAQTFLIKKDGYENEKIVKKRRKKELALIFIILIISQIVYSFLNYKYFQNTYINVYNQNLSVLSDSVVKDIKKVLDYGVDLDRLKNTNEFLYKRLEGNPECSEIFILDKNSKMLYKAKKKDEDNIDEKEFEETNFIKENINNASYLIRSPGDKNPGFIVLRINEKLINAKINDALMDAGTIIIISLIVAFMLIELMYLISTDGNLLRQKKEIITLHPRDSMRIIRLTSFIFLFAAFVPLSFLPLHIKTIYEMNPIDIFNLSSKAIISIPISSYMFGTLLAMILIVFVMHRTKIRKVYFVMIAFYAIGTFLTIISRNIISLTAARLVAGFGFGGALLNNASMIITYTKEKDRSAGFGTNASGLAAASICSIPIGGVIVNRLGYEAGYWVAIIFSIMALLFTYFFIVKEEDPVEEENTLSMKVFFSLMKNRNILLYVFLMNIPFQLIYVGLFQFLFPLYMNSDMNLSAANIGRILCIFSIISLFASFVSRMSDKIRNDKVLLGAGALLVGAALIAFDIFPGGGIFVFLVVMVAMGIYNTFIDSIEEVFISKVKTTENMGEGSLLKIYKTYEKVISIVIPLVTGYAIMSYGFSKSLLIIGIYSFVGAIFFIIFAKNNRKISKSSEE